MKHVMLHITIMCIKHSTSLRVFANTWKPVRSICIFTHANGSRVSIMYVDLPVFRLWCHLCKSVNRGAQTDRQNHFCLSVCLSVRTIKPKWLKIKSPNLSQRSRYFAHQLILGQKVKGQGQSVKTLVDCYLL